MRRTYSTGWWLTMSLKTSNAGTVTIGNGAGSGRQVGSAAVVAVVVLGGCTLADRPASPRGAGQTLTAVASGPVAVDFEGIVAEYGTVIAEVGNSGTAPLQTSIVTRNGGRVRLAPGEPGAAARFPGFIGADDAPAAALVLRPAGGRDVLEPGKRDFAFGARFRLDDEHGGAGNPLMQRGRFDDEAQYQIQIDRGVPRCRILGSDGEAVVELDEPVATEQWVGIECRRRGDRVDLILTDPEGASLGAATVEQRTGAVRFDHDTGLSVGAEVGDGGTLPASTDQFHGLIDGVFCRRLS